MDFDLSNSEFDIINVLKHKRTDMIPPAMGRKRPFSFLSCRMYGYSEINFNEKNCIPDTENYFLCPPNVEYDQNFFDEEIIVIHLNFKSNSPQNPELIYYPYPDIKESFEKLFVYWLKKPPGYVCKCKAIVYDIFYKLYKENHSPINSKIKSSMEYLYENYKNTDFDINKMIECSFLSPAYFRRIFKSQYGCTVTEFVNRLRIEYAKSLMEEYSYSVGEISLMCGFSDEKYFSTVFKNLTGICPSEYK